MQVDAIHLDFVKAFDRVNHKLLLKKLHWFGICSALLTWFEDYLTDHVQRVTVLGVKGWPLPVSSGARQRSILGPLLFLIYVTEWLSRVTWRPLFLSLPMTRGASGQWKAWRMVLANSVTSNTSTHDVISGKSETLINPSACSVLSPEMLVCFNSPINYPMFKLGRWKLRRTLGF